jgi:hypothetical protein
VERQREERVFVGSNKMHKKQRHEETSKFHTHTKKIIEEKKNSSKFQTEACNRWKQQSQKHRWMDDMWISSIYLVDEVLYYIIHIPPPPAFGHPIP